MTYNNNNTLIFDTQYFVITHYYSTVKYLRENPGCNFKEIYVSSFENVINRMKVKYNVTWDNVYLVKDCIRANIWRMRYLETYKASRKSKKHPLKLNYTIMDYIYNVVMPKLQEKYSLKVLYHDECEADDIIAILKHTIRNKDKNAKIIIISNDSDFIQLLDSNTTIINLKNQEVVNRIKMDPYIYLRYKIVTGDIADDIPGISSNLDPYISQMLAEDMYILNKYLKNNPDIYNKYRLNQILIDFEYIPKYIVEQVKDMILQV